MSDSFDSRQPGAYGATYGGFPQRGSRRRFLAKPPAAPAPATAPQADEPSPLDTGASPGAVAAAPLTPPFTAPLSATESPATEPPAAADIPPPALPTDDDDLPVLTAQVADPMQALPYDLPDVAASGLGSADVDRLVADIEASLRQQLPALIAGALSHLEHDLAEGLTALVEDAVRDALAEYQNPDELASTLDDDADEGEDLPELDAIVPELSPAVR